MISDSPGAYWRVRWAVLGALVALALVGLAWLLVTVVKSPQDALASAAAPSPSQITVPVKERALDLSVTTIARLVSTDRVKGKLGVDERVRAEAAARITVVGPHGKVSARLLKIEPNGDFVLDLDSALPGDATSDDPLGADDSVRAVFTPAESAASSLVVPVSALFTSSAGATAVVKVEGGAEHEVVVLTGATVDGFVAVSPNDSGALGAGDEVLVSEPSS
jgi:hypothetical protein